MPDKKLKSTGTTLDGTPIVLRPLLPEDEPALQDLFAHMSREDVRLRFFTPMRELKHALAAPPVAFGLLSRDGAGGTARRHDARRRALFRRSRSAERRVCRCSA
jgi:hypothetical protein